MADIVTTAVKDLLLSQVQGATMGVISVFRHIFIPPSFIIGGVIVTARETYLAFTYGVALLLLGRLVISAIKLPCKPGTAARYSRHAPPLPPISLHSIMLDN